MGTKSISAVSHRMFTAMSRDCSPGRWIGLVAVAFMSASTVLAEQSQQQPTNDHQQLCKDLYNIYDTNMDEYYNKKNSSKTRQAYYVQAEAALSDFRKQGCKTKDMK